MKTILRTIVLASFSILTCLPSRARADQPFIWARGELGGAARVSTEPADANLGGHVGGQAFVLVAGPFGIGVRAAGTYFSPFQKNPDVLHASWAGGLALKFDGPWIAAFAGMHESLGENDFGLDALLGYDFMIGKNFGFGPFVGYSVALADDTLQFLEFGLSIALGVPFAGEDDPDGDGILGAADQCPNEAEDLDGNQDTDGCPETEDQDGDGILDAADGCPTEPEDVDQFQDDDGCPDPDNDGDGRLDAADACPNEAEDIDQFQDDDGCPDPDNDHDGVPDTTDGAPNDPEDRDGFQDEDGVPDPDNDRDGVPDEQDECPTAPGPVASRGCPQAVRLEQGRIRILQRIEFATGRATLKPTAFPILEEVRAVLDANAQIHHVRVEGHTDDRGNDARNMDLSQRRAQTVVTWLTDHGIAAGRLEPQGFGETRPLEPNTTTDGRQTNRRVEFLITDPAPPATPAPPAVAAPPATN